MLETLLIVIRGCFGFALLLMVLNAPQTQSVTFTTTPRNPTDVVEGLNSGRVSLVWKVCLNSRENLRNITIGRKRPDGNQLTTIATKPNANSSLLVDRKFQKFYIARSPATLVLKNVRRTDEYIYSLEIFYSDGIRIGRKETDVLVRVFVPPSITNAPITRIHVEAGKDITLTCNASGDPRPNITWTKDGVPMSPSSDNFYQFRLTGVQSKDSGSYKCIASNGYGSDASTVSRVDVKLPPRIILPSVREAEIKIGDDFVLVCYASGDPKPNITWTREGLTAIESIRTGNFLQLTNVTRMSAGLYRCTASNGYGNNATSVSVLSIKCGEKCEPHRIELTLVNETWTRSLLNRDSIEFRTLEYTILLAIWNVYARQSEEELLKVKVLEFRPGSVVAIVELMFRKLASDPLKPIHDEISNGRLSSFKVNAVLDVDPTDPATTTSSNLIKDGTFLHVVYSSVIFVLSMIFIVVVILLWRRRPNNPGPSTENRSFRYHSSNATDNQDQKNQVQANEAYVNISERLILSEEETVVVQSSPVRNAVPNRKHQMDSEYMSIKRMTTKFKKWEVKRENVQISKVIGKGAFCQVAKATLSDISGVRGTTTVAVKMLKENAPDNDKKDLLSELDLMKKLKPHPHVIQLMGCVTKTEPLLVLIEYIPYGDLLGYLRKSRGLNDTYFKDPDVKPDTNLTSEQLIQFALQIADGMNFLSANKIIHRDLAARNVLVGEGEKCKLTDFGMARNVNQDDIYNKTSRGRLPVKWTAYEGLVYGKYTTQSDVWSFGVVLYEIFTVGGSPYPAINAREIANKLQQGYRMPKPKHVDQQLYQIMVQCWQENPNDRPTFSSLKDVISRMAKNKNDTYFNMREYDTTLYANVDDLTME
ncbi:fibroblast growth factor receptor 1-A-like [Stylophora pistillata]|uniref:fibroblast growth factor receptor 1-A-like n=1 Tax=Stylophora pistillata TaxID=50429 RepID=UPI000C03DCAC|nr:fibroblast growth factor receptor 1-A-like [Stylophora pistillata]